MLRGVVGRKVASALEKWFQDPQSVAAGARMAFSLPTAAERKAVILYLASTSAPTGTGSK
jgi:cytochrome c2